MSRQAIKIALTISLVLNVFILGAIAGAWLWRPTLAAVQPRDSGLAAAGQALPPEVRQAFRETLANARRDAQPDSQAAREARGKLANLLNQTQLDRAAVDEALNATRTADARVRARMEAAVIDFAVGLDPKNRAVLIGGLSARGQILLRETKK